MIRLDPDVTLFKFVRINWPPANALELLLIFPLLLFIDLVAFPFGVLCKIEFVPAKPKERKPLWRRIDGEAPVVPVKWTPPPRGPL